MNATERQSTFLKVAIKLKNPRKLIGHVRNCVFVYFILKAPHKKRGEKAEKRGGGGTFICSVSDTKGNRSPKGGAFSTGSGGTNICCLGQ